MYATIWLGQDAHNVYLKITVLGMQCDPLIREADKFMGAFPILISFEAKPLSGTIGAPTSSEWPDDNVTKVTVDKSHTLEGGLKEVGGDPPGRHTQKADSALAKPHPCMRKTA